MQLHWQGLRDASHLATGNQQHLIVWKRQHPCSCTPTAGPLPQNPSATTHPWHNLCLAFLPPLCHLGVDLLPDLHLDLARVAREEGEEPLRAAVDDVNLVQRHRVHHLLTLLELPFRALHELGLKAAWTWE